MSRFNLHSDRGLYRSRDGVIWGVCRGVSDHFNLKVGWVRFFTVLALLFTGIWPILIIYILAALLMKPEPAIPLEREDQKDFYDSYMSSRQRTLRGLKRRFSNLDRRLRRMEDNVTSRDYDWEERFNA